MINREYKKPIQKNREHCDLCALVKEFCICSSTPHIESNIQFILLTHANELKKRNNTGLLIESSMPNTLVIEWKRKEEDKKLLDIISSEDVYLLYPEASESSESSFNNREKEESLINKSNAEARKLNNIAPKSNKLYDKKTYIVILDGTWQEAQKIYNRSDYLKNIEKISLSPDNLSQYALRRKKNQEHLCTVEAAALCLNIFGEKENSQRLMDYFLKFQENYKYSQSN